MKWKKKVQNKKYRGHKIASAVCVLGVLAVCLGVIGYRINLKADEKNPVTTRGVIDQISQIPETKKTMFEAKDSKYMSTLGTEENPFFILEVVPYEEYALYGYHIGGCEPIDMSKNYGHSKVMGLIRNMNTAVVELQSPAYFFEDEPEAKPDAYDDDENVVPREYWSKNNEKYEGYYELVEDGEGAFRQNEDGSLYKAAKGNIIWHTICKTEMEEMKEENPNLTFSEPDAEKKVMKSIGERIYTKRVNTKDDPVMITYGYYYYHNKDNFLSNSILQKKPGEKVDQKLIDNYKVIIKTITPRELNSNPKWADYADLYVFSRVQYYGGLKDIWKKYNRLGHTSSVTNYSDTFVNTDDDMNKDISWDVVEKIFDKVAERGSDDTNTIYAGMIMGSSLYKMGDWYNGSTLPSADIPVFDWNLKKIKAVEGNNEYVTVASGTRCNNNVYKMALMLLSMDSKRFRDLYMSENKEERLIKNGEFLLRDGDDKTYWSEYTFLFMNSTDINDYRNPYQYWQSSEMWDQYGITRPLSKDENRNWVDGHFFSFNDDNMLTFDYMGAATVPDQKFNRYQDYLDDYYDEKGHGGTSSDSVRYILGDKSKNNDSFSANLNILDIEPGYDKEEGYSLTANYIRNMLPRSFSGDISIKHMTTAEFIGNSEDLNSTYNMIFIGLDQGAYNVKRQEINNEKGIFTYWNDSNMNGKIYFHTGDKLEANPNYKMDGKNFSVSYLWPENETSDAENTLRFPGNDLTIIKVKELENFLKGGYPVVAESKLYDMDVTRIDQHSNICNFIKTNKTKENLLSTTSEKEKFYKVLKKAQPEITYLETPDIYNGETGKDNKVDNPNYLKCDEEGYTLFPFWLKIDNADGIQFQYRIYIDQNQDGKFDEDELYDTGKAFDAKDGKQGYTYKLSPKYMGLIQWKIEVYQVDNEQVHFSKTGCSAAQIKNPSDKKKIKVLQILPEDVSAGYQGCLDLSSNPYFTKYYNNLNDYTIQIDTKTLSEFEEEFTTENPFHYDYSEELDDDTCDQIAKNLTEGQRNLYDYNMYIIGFGDRYDKKNLNNKNGAVDFIKFFIACGKSVLFTHDLTSFFNINSSDYGYTANTYLRDLMGMNRYQAVSRNLTDIERQQLISYQSNLNYDTVTDLNGNSLGQKHGYTYYAMRRLALKTDSSKQKMPYSYLQKNDIYKNFESDNAGRTTHVSRTNEGQITQYPYKIPEKLTVAATHGQYYQLDMEDPNVTVWYCLADNSNNSNSMAAMYEVSPNDAANNYYIYSKENVFYSGVGDSEINGDDEAKLFINTMIAAYRASYEAPTIKILNEEAEVSDSEKMNYRMTVGFEEYDDDDDSKNSQGAESAETTAALSLTAADDTEAKEGEGIENSDDYVKIRFSPEDFNAITPKLTGMIYYEDDNGTRHYVRTIYDAVTNKKIEATQIVSKSKNTTSNADASDGTTATVSANEIKWGYQEYKDANGKRIRQLENMHEYYFYYPKKYLSEWTENGQTNKARRKIHFYIKNDKSKLPRYQTLDLTVNALFKLD